MLLESEEHKVLVWYGERERVRDLPELLLKKETSQHLDKTVEGISYQRRMVRDKNISGKRTEKLVVSTPVDAGKSDSSDLYPRNLEYNNIYTNNN